MLLPIFPVALEPFSVGVVQNPITLTVVIFELPLIDLPIWPEIFSFAILFVLFPVALVDPPVWPVEEPLTMHCVFLEEPLVDFPFGGDGSAKAIAEAVFKPTLVERGFALEDLKAFAIGAVVVGDDLTAVLGS